MPHRRSHNDLVVERAQYQTFIDLADTLVDGSDELSVLHVLASRCVSILDVAAAAVLLVDEHGALNVVASASEQATLAELHKLQGPSPGCYHTGTAVAVTDWDNNAHRWAGFVAEARTQGLNAAHALPMRRRKEIIGTLNLYGTDTTVPSDQDLVIAQALADVATIGVLHYRARRDHETENRQLQHALNSRVIIEQAKGILASRGNLPIDAAFAKLRHYARSNNLRVRDLAAHIATDPTQADHVLRHGHAN